MQPKPSVVIFVDDVPRLSRFYADVARMTVFHADDDHVVLDDPMYQLVLHGMREPIVAPQDVTVPPRVRYDTAIKVCLPVPSIAAARETAIALGGHLHPVEQEWEARGFRACDGYDPEGNVFQVRASTD